MTLYQTGQRAQQTTNKLLRPHTHNSFLMVTRARMHHKVVGNFGSEVDVRSLYYRGFRFNETSDNGACTHGQPAK